MATFSLSSLFILIHSIDPNKKPKSSLIVEDKLSKNTSVPMYEINEMLQRMISQSMNTRRQYT